MNLHTTHRATAFGLAALLTLSILSSINLLATSPAPDALIAAVEGAASHVVASDNKRTRG